MVVKNRDSCITLQGSILCNSSNKILPTPTPTPRSTIERPQRKNNLEYVLDILDKRFKGYRSGIKHNVPNESIGNVVKLTLEVDTFLDFIHTSDQPAIITPSVSPEVSPTESTSYLTHNQAHTFIEKLFNLAKFNLRRGDRVAVCLPDGPTLSLCLLSVMTYCTCVPSNSHLTSDELLTDYISLKVKAVIMPHSKLLEPDALADTLRQRGLQLIGLKTSGDSNIQFTLHHDPLDMKNSSEYDAVSMDDPPTLNTADDVVMLFQTSGTTGEKKIVPYRLRTVCTSTVCVAFSLDLKQSDTIVNMMPLFHVGGIIRSLLTPMFTGGSIIQSQGFDPVIFCDILVYHKNTVWFYGVPSMQKSIIREAIKRKLPTEHCNKVKKICNAGGDLSPSLAKELKMIFTQAIILPSYGMTECMPICAPPVDYGLERAGTSGQVIGPDLAVLCNGEVVRGDSACGHILLRGGPCFEGYENENRLVTFDEDGWFDTGDVGYIKDGYIYITGRSKEVINRGGEIVSPMEIENVLLTHPKIAQVMVFSVPHELLQETIGCVIVTRDSCTRPDIRSLRTFLENRLHPSKHPQLLVYMEDLPKNNLGKLVRMNFSNRLNIQTIMDSQQMLQSRLLYEAELPSKYSTINQPILSRSIEWSVEEVVQVVKKNPLVKDCTAYLNEDGHKFLLFIVKNTDNCKDDARVVQQIQTYLQSHVHDYMLPTDIIIVQNILYNEDGSIDKHHLEQHLVQQRTRETDDPLTLTLCDIFALAIGIPKDSHGNSNQFPVDGDFFDYGGNSIQSGFVISLIRSRLGVALPPAILYESSCRTPMGLAKKCADKIPSDHPLFTRGYVTFPRDEDDDDSQDFNSPGYKKRMANRPLSGAKNPFNPLIMFFQASPIYLMQPLFAITRLICFTYVLILLSSLMRFESGNTSLRFLKLLLAVIITKIISNVVFPVIGILVKWIVIGRYRPGTYPLWGQYYLRWWFVNKILCVADTGIFKLNETLYALYLRLLGAKIGRNSRISCDANIQEYDLITIGSDCYIDRCTMRPFVLTRGHMNLSKIVIGDDCVVGLRSNVVAGSKLPNETVIGPQTTTYARDMLAGGSSAYRGTSEGIRLKDLCPMTFPEPHFIFEYLIGWPLIITVNVVSHLPCYYCFYLVSKEVFFRSTVSSIDNKFAEMILYFANPKRIAYYLLSIAAQRTVVPLLYMLLVILVKRFIIGKFRSGPRNKDRLSSLRHWLMRTLLTKEKWMLVLSIVGTHYEMVSVIYRLLGAKVGRRVYWPGVAISIVEFDLLTVGNDVSFGSRSHIMCGDAVEYAPVIIEDGAMCADNCVLLPGCRIGRNAILGSGGLMKKNYNLPDGSLWYGSFNGNAVKLRDSDYMTKNISSVVGEDVTSSTKTIISMNNSVEDDIVRPFGRAFYKRKANYFVLPLALIIIYNSIVMAAGTLLWALPYVSATQASATYIRFNQAHYHEGAIVAILFGISSLVNVLATVLAILIEISAKWILFGRRQQGLYNWDESSYVQRWQVLLSIQAVLRRDILILIGGTSWIVLYFRAVGCRIGKRVCLYPSISDPVMTEPDLVVLEDDVAIDRAFLISHLNPLGQFSINPIRVGAGSVLQNDSRLGSGAKTNEDCVLLDHSYIIPGEVAEAHSVWQGYPAVITSIEEQYSIYNEKKSV